MRTPEEAGTLQLTRAIPDRSAVERATWVDALGLARTLPLYQGYPGGTLVDLAADPDWDRLPTLGRADLSAAFPHAWLPGRLLAATEADAVEYATTSGSSGQRIHIARPRGWWAEEHRRAFPLIPELRGFAVGRDPKVSLTTLDCSTPSCRIGASTPEDRTVANTLYLNRARTPAAWTRLDVERMATEWRVHSPALVDADPVLLVLFIDRCELFGIALPPTPPVISLDYELVTTWALRHIRQHFATSIVNLHGSTELGCLLASNGGAFIPIEPLIRLDCAPFSPRRGTWRLIVSSVKNPLMPLLRYDLGDVVRVSSNGRVSLVCGRQQESLPDAQGEPVVAGEIDEVLGVVDCSILVYQLRRTAARGLDLGYVMRHGRRLQQRAQAEIAGRLHNLLGPGWTIDLTEQREIRPAASGKFALVATPDPLM